MKTSWFQRGSVMLLMAVLTSLFGSSMKAQTLTDTMQGIYQRYDSMRYLTFDVRYIYTADTVNGETETDQLLGMYTLSDKKALYKLGSVEVMQNDSLMISVYHDDKIMMVAPRQIKNAGSLLPLREILDSTITSYRTHYAITHQHNAGDSMSTIHFAGDSTAPFAHFYLLYNRETQLIQEMRYVYYEEESTGDLPRSSLPDSSRRQRRLTLYMENYRFDNISPELYEPSNYVWKEGSKWTPVSRFSDYRVYYTQPL